MAKKRKEHSLTGRIDARMMRAAFKAVKRNRGAAGIDKVSVNMFEANLEENLAALMRDLKKGNFQPKPLRRVYIPKGKSKLRPLGIPAVRDRVAQEVLRRLLSPIFERLFHDASYGFRPRRGCHNAIWEVLEHHRQGYEVVLDADIKGFFDNIPHRVIMSTVAEEVADGNILRLTEKFLKAGVMENGVFKPTRIGTPQGGVISPLLANAVLNKLDWRLAEAGYRFVRYADDFVVICQFHTQAEEALALVAQILEDQLGLQLSSEKTVITTYRKGYSFLGFWISASSVKMRPKSVEKFKDKVRELTRRKHNLDIKAIVKLNRVIRGTANYFARIATCRKQLRYLDAWIRMRLRCMKFKRKSMGDNRRFRNRVLRKLGLLSLVEFLDQFACQRALSDSSFGALSVGVARCGKTTRR
jgi:group II intron reverse transcriptase/maturase